MEEATRLCAPLQDAPGRPQNRDRLCERIAHNLVDAGLEPTFQVTSADLGTDAWLICADRYWRLRFLAEPDIPTALECAHWIAEHVDEACGRTVREIWALGLGFVTRDSFGTTPVEDTQQALQHATVDEHELLFVILYQAARLRASQKFYELHGLLSLDVVRPLQKEPVIVALTAHAALADYRFTREYAREMLDAAWSLHGGARSVIDLCLNGLAYAVPFPGQGELLEDLADQAVALYPEDHAIHYWRAQARLMTGDYARAGISIQSALDFLPAIGTRISHALLLDQYRQLKATIQLEHRRSPNTEHDTDTATVTQQSRSRVARPPKRTTRWSPKGRG